MSAYDSGYMLGKMIGAGIAALIVVVGWGLAVGLIALLVHRRMAGVERRIDRKANPSDDKPLLWLAVAAIAWPFSAGVALVGMAKPEWSRLGRNATLVFLVQVTVMVLAAIVTGGINAARSDGFPLPFAQEMQPIVAIACGIFAVRLIASTVLFWMWSGHRSRESLPNQTRRLRPELGVLVSTLGVCFFGPLELAPWWGLHNHVRWRLPPWHFAARC